MGMRSRQPQFHADQDEAYVRDPDGNKILRLLRHARPT
jgi:hypothetical protein